MKTKTKQTNRKRSPALSSTALLADISRLQREIFALRKSHKIPAVAQRLLDDARETLHAAKVSVQWEVG